jgi:hypothetical protein
MLSPKLDVDIVLFDVAERQWRCTSFLRVFMLRTVETALRLRTDRPLFVSFSRSFQFCEAQIDNKACGTD